VPARKARRSARVTTRTGDRGETSLFSADRVRKTDPRIEALGDLDEAQAVMGVARSLAPRSGPGRELLELQRGLYVAMAEVATPRDRLDRLKERIDGAAVARLERSLDALKRRTPIEGRFVIPGDDRLSATLDHARTVVRRAERHVVECVDEGFVSGEDLLPWLNRVSDVLFVLARSAARGATPRRKATRSTSRGL
jgi:cob(I)alamin adenosyltransferase